MVPAFLVLLLPSAQPSTKVQTPTSTRLDVLQLVLEPHKPDFDKEVLIPLHKAQAEKAAAASAAAAKAAAELAAKTQACEDRGGTYGASGCIMPPPVVVAAPVVPTLSGGDAEYKTYIYNHESGNNPTQWNSEGCVGIGQACPASKLLAVCPTLDYACEDAWFSNYAVQRYGSWYNAYLHWLSYRNW